MCHSFPAISTSNGTSKGNRVAAKKRRGPKHPGVVLLKPDPERRIGHRVRYKNPDTGKVVKETLPEELTTVEQREQWAVVKSKELAARRLALEGGAVRATGIALKDAIERYFSAHPHLGARTIADTRSATNKLLTWAGNVGVQSADDLTRARLIAFREYLIKQPKRVVAKKGKRGQRAATAQLRGANTVNGDLRKLRTALRYLRSAELLPKVNNDDLRDALKQLRVVVERIDFLKQADIAALLEAAVKHDAATFDETRDEHAGRKEKGTTPRHPAVAPFILFVLMTGTRLNEAVGLDWGQVDLDALNHEGKKVGEIHLLGRSVKTHQARTVDLEVSAALRALLVKLHKQRGGQGRVFTLTEGLVEAAAKRLKADYGAPNSFTYQGLRRTCETYLVNAPGIFGAASAYRAAKQLGHSVQVAEKHYLGLVRGIPRQARTLEAAMQIDKLAKGIVKGSGALRRSRS
jgi:integrase